MEKTNKNQLQKLLLEYLDTYGSFILTLTSNGWTIIHK